MTNEREALATLVETWRLQAKRYLKNDDMSFDRAVGSADAYQACAQEIESLLASAPSAPQPDEGLKAELARIDAMLARRPALDKPTRVENVEHAITTAGRMTDRVSRLEVERDIITRALPAWAHDTDDVPLSAQVRAAFVTMSAEIEKLKLDLANAKFAPIGDNHHNAAACPYCSPKLPSASQEEPTQATRIALEMAHAFLASVEMNTDALERDRSDVLRAVTDALEALSSSAPVERPRCVIGEYCRRHQFIHGAEAEELRERIEGLITGGDDIYDSRLRDVLDEVDARDSLALLEAAPAETQEERADSPQDSLLNPVNQVYFRAGLIACREYMARFVEAQDPAIAQSIRANWWPSLGPDFGPPRLLDFYELTVGEYGTETFRCKTADEVSPTLEALPVALGFLATHAKAQPSPETPAKEPSWVVGDESARERLRRKSRGEEPPSQGKEGR